MSRMEDEEFRRRKMEEALEVKSLRRIISAYLNYPEAAEEDIRRYERYFRRLPPSHKALLLHLPLKFKKLRWCISQNSCFIFEMLKAFDPPLDMSQGIDISSEQFVHNVSDNNPFSGERIPFPCQCESSSGQISSLKDDELRFGGSSNAVHGSPKAEPVCEEKKTEPSVESNPGNCSIGSAFDKKVENADGNNVKNGDNNTALSSVRASNARLSFYQIFLPTVKRVCVSSPDWLDPALQLHVPLVDVDKVRCIIRNIVRDWASEGQRERDQCYKPILEELGRLFPDRTKGSPRSCLVPGAGLGRLALEISCLGFISQGNEFSYYMMICSSFILNHTQTAEEWTIYPWVHSNCNSLSDSDQLRPVSFPDIHPASAGITEGFSMCGGDFVEVYNDSSQVGVWDAVVTCFFIDTAHNVVEYIEIISRILKDGGVWINLGPLLYHFADMYNQEDDMSIELSLEDVKKVANHYGFQIEKESTIETTYTTNPRSMMQNRYFAAFWTMRKKPFAMTEQRA